MIITFIRSTIFNVVSLLITLLLCLSILWALFLPRRYARPVIMLYFRAMPLLEKYILNLDYRVEGLENLPQTGSYILAVKHQSTYETFKMPIIFGDIAIIMKKELKYIPLWGWYAAKLDMIFVDRKAKEKAMQSLINGARETVAHNRPIVIFPQGTRVKITDTPKEKPYKQGAVRIYDQLQIPIVPVATNSGLFWPKGAYMKKSGCVTFKIMPPIMPGLKPEEALKHMRNVIEEESLKLL